MRLFARLDLQQDLAVVLERPWLDGLPFDRLTQLGGGGCQFRADVGLGRGEEEIRRRVDDCLELLEITRLRRRAPYALSGGEKRRVAFACVLAVNPEVLVADEQLASLDELGRNLIVELFKTLRSTGKTLVFASHNEEFISEIADFRFNVEKPNA